MRLLPFSLLLLIFASCQRHTYTIMTWNIRFDNPNDGPDRWDIRKAALAAHVAQERPAVIGLQEALLHQIEYLAQQWPAYRWVGAGRDDGGTKGEFSPLFYDSTQLSLLACRTIWLSPTPERPSVGWDAALPRVATVTTLKDRRSNDSLWVINTHFDHIGANARLHAAELIFATLATPLKAGKKVIFMGDLNAQPDEAPVLFLQQQPGLFDACPVGDSRQGTFNGFELAPVAPKRIDYVWLSHNWDVKSYRVAQPKINGRQVSDHYPVQVKVGY